MNPASIDYFLYLFLTVVCYWLLPSRAKLYLLLAASWGVYFLWDGKFVFLLIAATLFDFVVARQIPGSARKKWWLSASVAGNVLLLSYFKYSNLFLFSDPANLAAMAIPLGISFYTFHSISYVVDVYRGKIPAAKSFLKYAVYVSFFPKIMAGPIERADEFLPQLKSLQNPSAKQFVQGLKWMVFGLCLKRAIGDQLNLLITPVFVETKPSSAVASLLGVLAFTFQIYADFFGYTLIARGSSLLFGISLVENFRSPYLAKSPQDFWKRWHISLSSWFRDYVYIPLGGKHQRIRNVILTMALAGLWHGNSWHFVAWGLFHAGFLLTWDFLRLDRLGNLALPLTFVLVSLSWVLFKIDGLQQLPLIFNSSTWQGLGTKMDLAGAVFLCLLALPWWLQRLSLRITFLEKNYFPAAGIFVGFCLVWLMVYGDANTRPFLYFKF